MGVISQEKRLRNAQSLVLIGSLIVAVVVAVLLVFSGAPQWIAMPAGLLVYFVCWRLTLRIVRRRSDADLDRDAR
jgi:membrane protein YdbS with pleckstrin-like domain